ncbi:MAG: pyruvate kinase [Candidatus Sericytochromatia bacterium]|nr:pyruvate kinase [Candidatus Sericytochromatia bacterium]
MQTRRTKIVATVGPASRSAERIRQLIVAGVDVFRLNFSHGKHPDHAEAFRLIRQAALDLQRPVAIMQDLQGPKIRVSDIAAGEIPLRAGAQLRLVSGDEASTAERVYISYPHVAEDVPPGATILLDDGKLELRAIGTEEGAVLCEVVLGGILKPRKGVNFPGVPLRINALSEKDKDDMLFGTTLGVDFVAISFVQRASDILEAKDYLESFGKKTPIIAKIERQEAINNLDDIIAVTDAVMVARGDLGVETPAEMVPLYQKRIIAKCNEAGKPVITATQMLDSMVTAPRPTRAEASDVANAILDGTDAIMLSNETAVGEYPLEAVRTMVRIAIHTEPTLTANMRASLRKLQDNTVSMAISAATCQIAEALGATAIITATHSGSTARQVSKYRPHAAILAATPSEDTFRHMSLVWGVTPVLIPTAPDTDSLINSVIDAASSGGMLHDGDTVVISAGVPMGQPGTTNLIKVESVSTILAHGSGLGQKVVTGRAVLGPTASEAMARVGPGDILVAPATDRDYIPAMELVAGLIVEQGGLTSHAAIAAMSLGIPVIVGVANALTVIPDGQVVTIDPKRGLIVAGRPKSL